MKPGTKIKDLPKNTDLKNLKVKTPTGVVGYLKSQWGYPVGKAGVWLSNGRDTQIFPQFLDALTDVLEWEVTEDEVNCDKLCDLEHIDLYKK
jgi:hypothetical protein